jgi:23S rRNA-/tRNA-specific pseudouridylate synthase
MEPTDDVRILHRDPHLLVLHKPAGLPTTAPPGGVSLAQVALELDPGAPRVHPTSRLDAETTGLVVFARTRRATRALLGARAEGAYRRVYLAVTERAPEPPEGTWTWSIERDPRDPRKRVAGPEGAAPSPRGGKAARTDYRVAASTALAAMLHARPATGRTHQIRVHAAAAGCPLLGDVHYGGARRRVLEDGAVVTARRVMLHCAAVAFPHPDGSGEVQFRAQAPEDFASLWRGLGGALDVLAVGP